MVEFKLRQKTVDLPYTLRIPDVTEEMFDDLTDEDTKAELINGMMVTPSPAAIEHDEIGGFIRELMSFYASEKDQGDVLGPDSIVHLTTCRKFCPDAYFVRKNRMRRPRPKEFEGAPDMVVEILSPSNRSDDLDDKRPAYQEAGVGEIWFVDPDNRQVVIDRKRRKRYGEEIVTRSKAASSVLPGFWVDCAWLWADPLPNRMACLRKILAGKT